MDFGNPGVRASLLPKPVFRVPERATVCDGDFGADSGGAGGTPDGGGGDKARVHEGDEVGVHTEPREVQREGARAYHYLRKFGSR